MLKLPCASVVGHILSMEAWDSLHWHTSKLKNWIITRIGNDKLYENGAYMEYSKSNIMVPPGIPINIYSELGVLPGNKLSVAMLGSGSARLVSKETLSSMPDNSTGYREIGSGGTYTNDQGDSGAWIWSANGCTINAKVVGKLKRLVYDLDGVNNYITIPQVDLVAGDTVEFKFVARSEYSGTNKPLCNGATPNNAWCAIQNDGVLIGTDAFSYELDGNPININDPIPTDNQAHKLTCTMVYGSLNLKYIATNDSTSSFANFPIYDLDIKAASGNRFYPINDGWSANPVIADSVSGQDGTAFNFNETNWIEIDV